MNDGRSYLKRQKLFKQLLEGGGDGGLELHGLASHGMGEAEEEGMEAETAKGIAAIAILRIATDGMGHVGSMDAYLILAACLQLELYERVVGGAIEHMIVGDGELASIIDGRGIGDVGLVVLEPVLDGALVALHLA